MGTMAPFFFNQANPVSQQASTISPEVAAMTTTAQVQGYQSLSNTFMNMGAQMAGKSSRLWGQTWATQEQMVRNELEKQNFLAFPKMAEMINKGVSEETIKLIKINEAKRLDQLPLVEKSYLSNNSIKAQEDYMNAIREYQTQAGPNGEGYLDNVNKWFDAYTPQILESAPSDISKANMLERMQTLRLQAIGDGIKFEDKRRKDNAVQQSSMSIESLAKQAIMAPENYPAYIEQASHLKENLIAAGVEPAKAAKWEYTARGDITKGFMFRQIKDNPMQALELLTDPLIGDNLDSSTYIATIGQAVNEYTSQMKSGLDHVDRMQAMTKIQSGLPLDENNPNDKKALDSFYETATASLRDPNTGQFNQEPKAVAQSLLGVLKQSPALLPSKFKDDFRNGIIYGDVNQATAYSRLVGAFKNDPTMSPSLHKLDPVALQMGMYLDNAIGSGENPQQALAEAKNRFLKLGTTSEETRKVEAQKLLSLDYITSTLKGEFSSWLAPVVGISEWTLGEGFKQAANKFYNPANLIDASSEYARHFTNSYAQFGDQGVADQYAKTQLHKTFISTTVNGDNEVMMYGPGIIFPGRERDFRHVLYKSIDPNGDGLTKPMITVDGKEYEWRIESTDQFGYNYARQMGAYPMFYIDDDGYKRPLLDDKGFQKMFVYQPGLTTEEIEATQAAREKQEALHEQFNQGISRLGEIADRIRKSPNYEKMTPDQRRLLQAQLTPSLIGK